MNDLPDDTLGSLQSALQATPHDAALHRAVAELKLQRGEELHAGIHLATAQILDEYAAGTRSGPPVDLFNVATAYFMRGFLDAAELWYRIVLWLEPDFALAWMNLTAIHSAQGRREEAERCRERAYRLQRVFVELEGEPAHRVLVLCSGRASGNVPMEILLPTERFCRIKYIVDYADESEDKTLPAYDFVFNAIGEPDVAAPVQDRLERFAAHNRQPLLNAPAAVARTRRDRLPELLDGIPDIYVAPCLRIDTAPASRAELAQMLTDAHIDFPVLIRPASSHGGEGLVRLDSSGALGDHLTTASGAHYLSRYIDYRSADGYFRKYRMIFVAGRPYPYHLAISANWIVHYESSGMESDGLRIEEERRFLDDPEGVLGKRAMAAIAAIGERLGLDYAGVDFTVLPDGRVLVFEANATMLVHTESASGQLAHKNRHVQHIVDAFVEFALAASTGVASARA